MPFAPSVSRSRTRMTFCRRTVPNDMAIGWRNAMSSRVVVRLAMRMAHHR